MRTPAAASSDQDTDRKIGDLLRVGVIESVDAAGKAVVSFGDQLTPPIEWLMAVGDTTIWLRPTVGQQVLVASPEGDAEQASIVGGLPSDAHPALPSAASVVIKFKDGGLITYDPDASRLNFDLPGEVQIIAPNGVNITGDTMIDGTLQVTGDTTLDAKLEVAGDIHTPKTITGDTDVVASGKSGKGHKHPAGSPLTGTPQ
jgi:phage baseplate assembly protein V